ncbi:MAG TPA: hypothetical protein VGK99_23895 [Acidobacteriota bacterium]|jgi:hypothetical protein
MRKSVVNLAVLALMFGIGALALHSQEAEVGPLTIWVEKQYSSWDNPLQSEFSINGKMVNIYSASTFETVQEHFKPGWNTVTVKTTPQEPASKSNGLIFRLGPATKQDRGAKMTMDPVLWKFVNNTDWKFANSAYSHPLGPNVKEVTLTYNLYYAGMAYENQQLKAGDFVLAAKPTYASWNSPVTATLYVNGTPLNSFTLAERQLVITPLLKQGKNEIKLISHRVKNSIADNDVEFRILGPAEWNVSQGRFVLTPVIQFKAKQGWTLDSKSGMLINPLKPDSETIERVIPFVLKEAPKAGS